MFQLYVSHPNVYYLIHTIYVSIKHINNYIKLYHGNIFQLYVSHPNVYYLIHTKYTFQSNT